MEQEAAFIEMLERVTRFAVEDGVLYFFTDSDEAMTFSAGGSSAD